MKKIIISILTILVVYINTGCNKLDQQPISSIPATNFWKTDVDAQAGVTAIYAGLQNTFSNTFTEWGDARSDNFTYGGTGENQVNVSLNGLDAVTSSADWGNLYNTIQRANLAIKYIPNIYNNSQTTYTKYNNYMAQAYAVRAFMYFWGVRLWGDVPLRLTPFETIDSFPHLARTNKDSVIYNAIIPDLLTAESLIDPNQKSTYFINQGAILSILAEVYMWNKDYANVIATTKQIRSMPNYSLVKDPTLYKDAFVSAATVENIWSLDWNYITDGKNGLGAKLGSNGNTSNYYIDTGSNFYHRGWDSLIITSWNDIRRNIIYDTGSYKIGTLPKQIWKFYPIDINTGNPIYPTRVQNQAKLPFYRYADIVLMQAEAYNAIGDTTDALVNVRAVRNRANAGPINVKAYNGLASQSDVLNVILDERQLELFAEGKRWFDLVRNNMVTATMDPLVKSRQISLSLSPTGFSDPSKILWPISRTALIADPSLVQNPHYSR